jgi:hypothetical protein
VLIPAPRPFSPFSNSSSRRKLRGTFAPIVGVAIADETGLQNKAKEVLKCSNEKSENDLARYLLSAVD